MAVNAGRTIFLNHCRFRKPLSLSLECLATRHLILTTPRAVPVLRVMSGNWLPVLHKYIPSHEPLIMKPIAEIWHRYVSELVKQIETAAPAILPQLQECLPVLRRILDEMQLRVREILNGVSRSSSDIQPEFRDALQTRLTPLFAQALAITGA